MVGNSLHDAVVVRSDVRRGAELYGALLRYLTSIRDAGAETLMTLLFCRVRVIQVMKMTSKM